MKLLNRLLALFKPTVHVPPVQVTESIIAKLDRERVSQMAENLLSDPLLAAIFESIAFQYRQEWELSKPADRETQQNAHFMLRALREVDGQIRSHARAANTASRRRA
jgi:hypothetical protein